MITRKALLSLAIFTLVCFGIAGAMGQHHHGLREVVGDISWNGFLLGLLLLVVASGVVLVRSARSRVRRSAT
jgi:branched-subunit amino acid permease